MTIQSAFTSDRMCLALTGMTVFEFNNLLPGFSTTLTEAQRARNTQRIGHLVEEEQACFLLPHINSLPLWST